MILQNGWQIVARPGRPGDYFLDIAQRRTAAQIADDLYHVPYEPYAPVRQQMLRILKLVNQSRKAAGLETLGYNVLRHRRRIVRPFEPVNLAESA